MPSPSLPQEQALAEARRGERSFTGNVAHLSSPTFITRTSCLAPVGESRLSYVQSLTYILVS